MVIVMTLSKMTLHNNLGWQLSLNYTNQFGRPGEYHNDIYIRILNGADGAPTAHWND